MKLLALPLILILAGCGVDQLPSSHTTPKGPPDSEIQLVYNTPQVLTVGQPAKIVPTQADLAESQVSIEPPLPDGLTYDPMSGIISGVPTKVTPATSYTIAINNEVTGNGQGVLVIEVNDGPLFYQTPIVAQMGTAVTPIVPRGTATLSNFSINPALPEGLILDTATGVISGTPTAVQPPEYFEITGTDSSVRWTFGVNIGVIDPDAPTSINNIPAGSTPACVYSGVFVGSYIVDSQPLSEGTILISFTPDGQSHAIVDDVGGNTGYGSDGTAGLSLDGSFQFNFGSTPSLSLTGNFLGENYLSGTYINQGLNLHFMAARIGGSSSANVRYTSKFSYSDVEIGVLDRTATQGSGVAYEIETASNGVYARNVQLPITAVFDPSSSTYSWQVPAISKSGKNAVPASALTLTLGSQLDDTLNLSLFGCQLN